MGKRTLLCLHQGCGSANNAQLAAIATGWTVVHAESASELVALVRRCRPRVGLITFSDTSADPSQDFTALERVLLAERDIEWIGLLPPDRLDDPAVRRLVAGLCYDYLTLPIDERRFLDVIGHAHGMSAIRRQTANVRPRPINGHQNGYQMVGQSPIMSRVFREIDKIAGVDASVMISGASGTGKELAALAIHRHSQRAKGPFVAVNCGAIPASLIQSELFGHEKGAFTGAHRRQIGRFEAADGGTIFLDEIGDLSLDLQVTLLRFLQERLIERVGSAEPIAVNVRVIAATHKDIEQSVKAGTFREDLYYRLHVLNLELPLLRDRPEDIEPLARHYLKIFAEECRRRIDGFSASALYSLTSHEWPGNVRELKNRVHRAVVMAERRLIGPKDLGFDDDVAPDTIVPLAEARRDAERRAIREALLHSGNNITKAARRLGISRVSFYRKMEKLELSS